MTRFGGDNKEGEKYYCVYERILDKDIVKVHAGNFFAPVEEKEEIKPE